MKGGRIHGDYPEDLNPATSDREVGRGRGVFIPTMPWEGMWYGMTPTDPCVFLKHYKIIL